MNIYKKQRILLILLLFISISACKIGEKYKQPSMPLPETFRGDTLENNPEGSSFGNILWRNFFNDQQLITLIDSALVNNYDMRTALKNIEIADRNLRQNKLEYLPSISGNIGSVNKQYRSKDFYAAPSTKWYTEKGETAPDYLSTYQSQFSTGVSFSWEADIWGKISNQKDMLKADYLDTYENRNAIQTKLIANIAKGYFNLMMLDAQVEVAKRNVQLTDSTLRMIQLQFKAGEITALAIQQTESQRLVAASLVPELEKEIAIQENALRVLTGELPDAINRSKYAENMMNDNQAINLGSPIDIVRNRPDIRSAEYALIAANAQMNINQIMRYPQLSLSGVFGVNAMLPKNWFNIPGALLGSAVGELTAPIFKNGRLKNKYQVSKLERDKAEIALQKTVLEATSEVSNSIIIVEKQKEQITLAKQRVENSLLAVKNANLLFRSGYATYLEVITAQSNALKSEMDLADIRQKQLDAYVNLYRALGGGWLN